MFAGTKAARARLLTAPCALFGALALGVAWCTWAAFPSAPTAFLLAEYRPGVLVAAHEWELMDAGPDGITGPLIHTDMPDSMETGWIFAGTRQGISRSMDCFCLWRDAGLLGPGVGGLTHDPRYPATLYAVAADRVWRSRDGGEQWQRMPPLVSSPRALIATLAGRLHALDAEGAVYAYRADSTGWILVSAP